VNRTLPLHYVGFLLMAYWLAGLCDVKNLVWRSFCRLLKIGLFLRHFSLIPAGDRGS
jgi:hypothetical protein